MHGCVREAVKRAVAGRMHGDHMTLQMRGQYCNFDAVIGRLPLSFIARGLQRGGLIQIKQSCISVGHLHPVIAHGFSPLRDAVLRIERGFVSCA